MNAKDSSGPAFPAYEYHDAAGQMLAVGGMTLRDYFAAKAMQALMHPGIGKSDLLIDYDTDSMSVAAYKQADAMLKARQA